LYTKNSLNFYLERLHYISHLKRLRDKLFGLCTIFYIVLHGNIVNPQFTERISSSLSLPVAGD